MINHLCQMTAQYMFSGAAALQLILIKGGSNEYIRLQIIKVDDNTGTIEYNLNKTLMAHGVQDHASIVYKDLCIYSGGF